MNLRGWPGTDGYRAPPDLAAHADRLGDRVGLVLVASSRVPDTGRCHPTSAPERFGLGACLVVLGRSVLGGVLIVPDDLGAAHLYSLGSVGAWATTNMVETVSGPRPWRVLTVSAFCDPRATRECEPWAFAPNAYSGAGFVVGAELGRIFGLMAEHCGPRRGANADAWELWLPGWGREHSNGWKRASPHRPCLYARARRVGWQVEFGPCGKGAGKRMRGGRPWRGAFVDVMSVAYALDADRGASFAEHRSDFGLNPVELPVAVTVDEQGATQMVDAVRAVHELALVLDAEVGRWFTTPQDRTEGRGRLDLARISSPGAVAAQIPARFRIQAPLHKFALTDAEHSRWAEAFHGGWCDAEPRLLGVLFQAASADVSSCFPLVAHRLGWWKLKTSGRVRRRNVTAALRRLCELAATDPAAALDPKVWARFGVTLVEVVPDGERWPVEVEDVHRPDGRMEVVRVTSSHRPMFYAWPDVVAAAVLSGRVPRILQAIRYEPVGRQEGLRSRVPILPGLVLDVDEDPAVALVRRRRQAKAAGELCLSDELRVVVNSLVYGNLCRFDETRRKEGRRWTLAERPGPWTFLPIASSVSAGARLLLAAFERMVADRGGPVAYRDTDSSLIPASPVGGVLRLSDGSIARELSWAEVDEVTGAFDALMPEPGWPVWKVERGSEDAPLHALVSGPKRHAEFVGGVVTRSDLDEHRADELVNWTEAGLGGTYCDPPTMRGRTPNAFRRWSLEAVEREVDYALARQHARGEWVPRSAAPWDEGQAMAFPALRRLRVTTPETARQLPTCLGARPGTRYVEGLRADCTTPSLPVALDPGDDLADWNHLTWVDKANGKSVRVTTDAENYEAVVLETLSARGVEWSRKPRTVPIDSVEVDPLLVQHVGRVSGMIDADEEGLGDLRARRPVYGDDIRPVAGQGELPLCGCGCGLSVVQLGKGAKYRNTQHRERAKKRRQRDAALRKGP